jgi:hypothetical protein
MSIADIIASKHQRLFTVVIDKGVFLIQCDTCDELFKPEKDNLDSFYLHSCDWEEFD